MPYCVFVPWLKPTATDPRPLRGAANVTGPVIMLGDFNCTPWSPAFAELEARSRLRNSQLGFGTNPTWPTYLPGMQLPIDHCLLSASLVAVDRFVGPAFGSDHYPLVVDVGVRDL